MIELELYLGGAHGASGIAAGVERAIEDGHLAGGARLPPVRTLAAELGVSPATVAAAYRTLAQRGLVHGRGRDGTRVVARGGAPRLRASVPSGLRNLADGNPDPLLLPDLAGVLGTLDMAPTLYGDAAVLPALAEAARAQLEADGLAAGDLHVVGGALDGIERVLLARLRPGDRVAVEDPGFPRLIDLVRVLGLEPVAVAVDADGPVPAALAAALARGVRALVVTVRAQNPTGAALGPERAEELGRLLAPHPQVALVEDDHGAQITPDAPATLVDPGERPAWAIIRSFSKALGPDLRLAVVTGDAATMADLVARQALGTGWVSTILQAATARLLTDPETRARIACAAELYAERRGYLLDELAARGIRVVARSGINVWIPVADETAAVAALGAAGFAVSAGQPYRIASPPAVRVTTATLRPDEAAAVAEVIARTRFRSSHAA